MAKTTLPIRVEPTDIERIDKIADAMAARAGVPEMGRSDAARAILLTGIESHEQRLGLTARPKGKRSK